MSNIVGIPLNFSCNLRVSLISLFFMNIDGKQNEIICILDRLVSMLCLFALI